MKIHKITIATIIAACLFIGMQTSVNAQTVNAEAECTTTSSGYGQSAYCHAAASASATNNNQNNTTVIYRDGKPIYIHKTVDAGVDMYAVALGLGAAITGSTALALKMRTAAPKQ